MENINQIAFNSDNVEKVIYNLIYIKYCVQTIVFVNDVCSIAFKNRSKNISWIEIN